jgi:hypothetical protein
VFVRLIYPDGAGSLTTATMQPSAGGNFAFTGSVPVGNHTVTALYHGDTLARYVSVLPRSTAIINIRLPGERWGAGRPRADLPLRNSHAQ